ncbi:complement receptor type 1-like isoform X8 [Xiphias gladius]|uniref:complement receptor type 1-like isoform X8 n=1 Tax=Xiphias gladius TaxID=8245 RepID=UPI001A98C82B|nr:complement receptor type 1-like isoform X8 [Xiphias gladius]
MCVTSFLLLSSLGLAITARAQDCPKPVLGPTMSLKDADIVKETFSDGTSLNVVCTVGYQSAGGSATITCSSGNWSRVLLKCERKNCGPLGDVSNGIVDYPEGTQFGDKLVVQCNSGYRLVGKSQIICEDKGWGSRLPTCEVMTCDPPPTIANGDFSPKKEESYDYREAVQYSCEKNYVLNGSKSVTCSEDGTFQPNPPSCIMVECEDPVIEHADWIEGSRKPHKYLSTVTYKCRPGYVMIGARTMTCEINGKWSPELPQCKLIATTPKATTTTTTTTAVPSTKNPKDSTNNLSTTLGIAIPAIIGIGAILTCFGCYYFGVPAFFRKKQGSQRGYPVNEATKHGEGVPLSVRRWTTKHT